MSSPVGQENVDVSNVQFWNELCGTHLAKHLGVTDDNPASLRLFDDWFFAFYPYLFLHIPFEDMKGKDVLEIGLGYGTVTQRIAESGARYSGLDIAAGPVEMANHRLRQATLSGAAHRGSILKAPFGNESFDYVVAIGCLHHTGDLQAAIDECFRLLRPGGKLIFMIYYAYSYRRFYQARTLTIGHFLRELAGFRGVVGTGTAAQRGTYDTSASGEAAPHTDWASRRSLRHMCSRFKTFSAFCENADVNEPPFNGRTQRREVLKTMLPRFLGLDIYVTAVK